MDITDTLAPNSDQLDAVDLLGQPRVFTIADVNRGNAEQPVNIALAEFPRVWRPGKSMRRVLAACWGTDASQYVGRQVKLYCDETVRFGNDVVGGTRIAALSHLDKTKRIPLLVSRGKSATFSVQPLTDKDRVDSLRHEWKHADPERRKVIEAEVAKLTGTEKPADAPAQVTPQPDTDPALLDDPTADESWGQK